MGLRVGGCSPKLKLYALLLGCSHILFSSSCVNPGNSALCFNPPPPSCPPPGQVMTLSSEGSRGTAHQGLTAGWRRSMVLCYFLLENRSMPPGLHTDILLPLLSFPAALSCIFSAVWVQEQG